MSPVLTPPDARGGDAALRDEVHCPAAAASSRIAALEAALDAARRETEAVKAERDAALQVMEMNATSGGFFARHAENAQARAERAEALCDSLAAMAGETCVAVAVATLWWTDTLEHLRIATAARDAALAASERDRADNDQLRGALNQAEACMSIVAPRSNKDEYLRILAVVRVALTTTPKVSHADA